MNRQRRITTVFAGAVALVTAASALPASAMTATTNMADALTICTDPNLSLDEKATAFVTAGWEDRVDTDGVKAALAAGLFLSQVEPHTEDTWPEDIRRAHDIAGRLRSSRSFDGLHFVVSPDDRASVTLEPNRAGLQTCLFAGQGVDLSAPAAVIGSKVLVSGPRTSVRGDFSHGTLIAHALDYADAVEHRLFFQRTFTLVLDRSSKGSEQ